MSLMSDDQSGLGIRTWLEVKIIMINNEFMNFGEFHTY